MTQRKTNAAARDSLYQRLGGAAAIRAAVDGLYERILADPDLVSFFDEVDIERLKRSQVRFFGHLLGGPEHYRGPSMKAVHESHPIEKRHFDRVASHLIDTLTELGVDEKLIDEVMVRVAPLERTIVNTPSPEGQVPMRDTLQLLKNNMLESAPINVMYADARELRLRYLNAASRKTLESLEQYLPCRVSELEGMCIDRFHKDPAHQRKILSDPRNLPHQAIIELGPEKLDLLVSAVYDDRGEYTGMMVTWSVVTQKLKLEQEMARVHNMMENAPVNVIYADAKDLTIRYLNPVSKRTLASLEQYLPCKVDELEGMCIDRFHKNPAHQRKILSDPRNLPHQAIIELGPEKLDLLVSAIHNAKGDYVGVMVNWSVVTQKLKLDLEMARIKNMMECAPLNIMYADKDLVLQYMNPASAKTLRGLEKHLPVKVDDMIGQSIDVFHKDPSFQRGLLANPEKNLPRQAEIQIGPETLRLLVSPIRDSHDVYLGAMVTWEVITETLQLEKEKLEALERTRAIRGILDKVAEAAQTLGSASEELTVTAQTMSGNAEETSAQANSVSAASEEVSKNVQSVATSAEQMSASIKEIASNAHQATKVANEAMEVAERTNVTVTKLGTSSAEVGQVIKVITSIAQQTNLLALNATIEAARAGEAGKGFAVVANEVKELAKETAKATEDISRKIEAIQGDTGGAVAAIVEIGGIIRQINDIQNTIASAVEEQTATTNEIGRNVGEAAKGTSEIAESITSVAQKANNTTQGAADLRQAAEELSRLAASLQEVVNSSH